MLDFLVRLQSADGSIAVLKEQTTTAEWKYCSFLKLRFGDDLSVCALFKHIRKVGKNYYSRRHVCLSNRMEQLASHWADFHEILYFRIFRNSVEKILVSLKSDKNYVHFI